MLSLHIMFVSCAFSICMKAAFESSAAEYEHAKFESLQNISNDSIPYKNLYLCA